MSRGQAGRDVLREKIAVALDVSSASEALSLARSIGRRIRWLKVGLQLFAAEGGKIVEELARGGHDVFLDLKLHDIPNTVSAAAVEAFRLGAGLITVHATGGLEMMGKAAEALARESRRAGRPRSRLIAVTTLTSLDEADLASIGLLGPPEELAVRLASLALRAGCDGVVCSPREISRVRARCGEGFFIVTPGIRPGGSERSGAPATSGPQAGSAATDDQKRIATPREALSAGADLLVVGRPITRSADPAAAVERLLDEVTGEVLDSPP